MILKTVLVEDEPLSRIFLNSLLSEGYPYIQVAATASTETEAIEAIRNLQPDLIFLDIELQDGSGFSVLKETVSKNFQVIFTTALDHHSINIIRLSGVEYIQKPIDREGLQRAIDNVIKKRQEDNGITALSYLMETLDNNNQPLHILINTGSAVEYLLLKDIIGIETADNNSSFFISRSGEKIMANTSLKEYESLLSNYSFFRTHQGHLVNIAAIKEVINDGQLYVVMNNGARIPLSEKKKSALLQRLDF